MNKRLLTFFFYQISWRFVIDQETCVSSCWGEKTHARGLCVCSQTTFEQSGLTTESPFDFRFQTDPNTRTRTGNFDTEIYTITEPDPKAREISNTRRTRPEAENPDPSPKCMPLPDNLIPKISDIRESPPYILFLIAHISKLLFGKTNKRQL